MSSSFKFRKAVAAVFLKDALVSLAPRAAGLLAGTVIIASLGCGVPSGSTINDILDAQLRSEFGILPTETARILLVNQTESIVEMDLLIDGVFTTLTCTPEDMRFEFTPSTCPSTIEVVQERRLSSQGALVGGRNYNQNPAFVFTADEFDCASTILFIATEDDTTADVL